VKNLIKSRKLGVASIVRFQSYFASWMSHFGFPLAVWKNCISCDST